MRALELPQADYAVITPYLVPAGPKRVNVGDGFILDSALRLIGRSPRAVFSSRAPLSAAEIARINALRFVLVVGANTLKDEFEITPGFDLTTLNSIRVPVVLLGVGHYGTIQQTLGLTVSSIDLLRALLERFPWMSVRCHASRRYVVRALPDLADKVLMTSCPVVHAVDGVDGAFRVRAPIRQLVVTVTDRGELDASVELLRSAAEHFSAERKVLALHQDYGRRDLWRIAEDLGFEVFRSERCDDFLALYRDTDVHFGNRVHAHLKCLSLGVRSFCAPYDLRQLFFAESLGYPLVPQWPDPAIDTCDFAAIAARRDAFRVVMDRFVAALRAMLD